MRRGIMLAAVIIAALSAGPVRADFDLASGDLHEGPGGRFVLAVPHVGDRRIRQEAVPLVFRSPAVRKEAGELAGEWVDVAGEWSEDGRAFVVILIRAHR